MGRASPSAPRFRPFPRGKPRRLNAIIPAAMDVSIEKRTSPLQVRVGPLLLKNPLISASGTFGYGEEMEGFLDPGVYGAIVGKSISLESRKGNPLPRIA